jgi:hypothetical protein
MRANWIKIAFFVLAALMLAGIAQVLLDPGLGVPDESRRTKHPSGFSIVPPHGWGASVFYGSAADPEGTLRVSPERSTGRQPSFSITRTPSKATAETAVSYTFQGKPAVLTAGSTKHAWVWRVDFERDGGFFHITLEYPVPTDVEHGPLWPFINSFRAEPVFNLAPTSEPATLSSHVPTTEPASR